MARFIGLPHQTGRSVTANTRVLGVPAAVAKLRGTDAYVRLQLGLLVRNAALGVQAAAKAEVPVETGNLQSGIGVQQIGSYNWQVTASSLDGDNAEKNTKEYAGFVEYGRKGMAGRFFMTQAYQQVRPAVAARLQLLARQIERL